MFLTECFSNFFRTIDIFGLKTEFRLDQRPKFTTASGGFFTLIFVGLMLLLFFSFGYNMINRTSPDTTTSQIYQTVPSFSEIEKDQYWFVFGMQTASAVHFIDEEIYTVSMIYGRKNQTTGKTQKFPLIVEPCSNQTMPKNQKIANYFLDQSGKNLSSLYCISLSNQMKMQIGGAWDQVDYGYIQFKINACNKSEKTCKPDDVINSVLRRGYFAYYSTDNLFDLSDYENPAHIFGRNYFISTTNTMNKKIFRYLKTNHIRSNEGWITDSYNEHQYFSFDYDQESFDFEQGPIIDFTVRKSYYEINYERRYKKIQSVFAEMTGFLQIIFVALYIIANPFIKKEYYETLTNAVYNFEIDDNNNKSLTKKDEEKLRTFKEILNEQKNKNELVEIVGHKSVASIPSKEIVKKKRNDEKIASYLLKAKESPLQMTMAETLKGTFSKDPELLLKKKQRETGVTSIFSQLDIRYVLNKFCEIDKLKILLLNEDQYHLFDYLPKPVILKNSKIHLNYVKEKTITSPVKKASTFNEITTCNTDIIMKAKMVKKAYLNITAKKEKMSEIDLKLIESLDDEIVRLLHEEEANNENKLEYVPSLEDRVSVFSEKNVGVSVSPSHVKIMHMKNNS